MDRTSVLMHQVMLSDQQRLAAYDKALQEVIQPGDIVADLGAGTLILSFLALKHGAAHVYAIEGDPATANMASAIAHHNNLQDKITVLNTDARTVELPQRPAVVVGEMMGNLGPEEQMAEIFSSFCQRNLVDGGRIVPERLTTHLAIVELANEGWGVWGDEFDGLDLSVVQRHVEPHGQIHFFVNSPCLLSEAAVLLDERLGVAPTEYAGASVTLPCTTGGIAHAVLGYFTAELSPSVTLSNFPTRPGSNWGVWLWPLPHTKIRPGDCVEATLAAPSSTRNVDTWRVNCRLRRGAN